MTTATLRRYGWCLPLAGLAGLLLLHLDLSGDEPRADREQAALPADLLRVPADAGGFLSVRLGDLWDSDLLKPTREQAKDVKTMEAAARNGLGVALGDIERLTFVIPKPLPENGNEPLMLLATRRPYQRDKVLSILGKTEEVKVGEQTLYVGDRGRAAQLIDDRTFALGSTPALQAFLETRPAREGPLSGALRHASAKHAVVAGLNTTGLKTLLQKELPPDVRPLRYLLEPLFAARSGLLIVDAGNGLEVRVEGDFASEGEARTAVKAAGGMQLFLMGVLDEGLKQMQSEKDMAVVLRQVKQMQKALREAPIEQHGKTLRTTARVPFDPMLARSLVDLPQRMRQKATIAQSQNNLKQIALAMINYADSNQGNLTPQAIFGKDGKPLLSWRVLILPYIEQQQLYNQFHLDEPWDSEHNKKLLETMPKTYASPADPKGTADYRTHYLGFVGPGAFFEGKKGLRFPASITDGTSNTIMAVEASKSVPWTKPEDIPVDLDKDLPKIGGLSPDGFLAAMCDGSVRTVSKKVSAATLKAAITTNAGDILGSDW
jgi:hypothetical protein